MSPQPVPTADPADILPPVVAERRDSSRQKVLFKGKIAYADGAFSTDCVIRDLSRNGARIALPKGQSMPTRAYLIDVRTGIAYESVVSWIRIPQFGLRFVSQHNLQYVTNPSLTFLKRLWTGAASSVSPG
jgi:hypothetical protein